MSHLSLIKAVIALLALACCGVCTMCSFVKVVMVKPALGACKLVKHARVWAVAVWAAVRFIALSLRSFGESFS